jgi:hypothetical protein
MKTLSQLVNNNLENDIIAKCFLNEIVFEVSDLGESKMFSLENGTLFSVYKTNLI